MTPLPDNPEELSEINVTPLIDVMLVLLIIFMVAAPLATVDVPVSLPPSSAAATDRPDDPVWLTLQAGGGLTLGDADVAPADLAAALMAATGGKTDTRIYLRADRAAGYGQVMALLDALRAAGFLQVALVGLGAGE